METHFITIYLFCLQARKVNFVTPLCNRVTFSKYKIYNGFYVINSFLRLLSQICVYKIHFIHLKQYIFSYIVTKNNFTMGILTLCEPNLRIVLSCSCSLFFLHLKGSSSGVQHCKISFGLWFYDVNKIRNEY